VVGEAVVFAIVLVLHRSSWRLLVAGALASGWYFLLVGVISRPRPRVPDVLQVTEHPGATSFPSGHVIFITLSFGLAMLCAGCRSLPPPLRPLGWAVFSAIVLTAAISRIYVGAHWPTDVLASIFIAGGWLALVTSIR